MANRSGRAPRAAKATKARTAEERAEPRAFRLSPIPFGRGCIWIAESSQKSYNTPSFFDPGQFRSGKRCSNTSVKRGR